MRKTSVLMVLGAAVVWAPALMAGSGSLILDPDEQSSSPVYEGRQVSGQSFEELPVSHSDLPDYPDHSDPPAPASPRTHSDVPDLPPLPEDDDDPVDGDSLTATSGYGLWSADSPNAGLPPFLVPGLGWWGIFVPSLDTLPADLQSAVFAPMDVTLFSGELPGDIAFDDGIGAPFDGDYGNGFVGNPVAVPAPGGAALLMMSGLGLAVRRSRR